MSEVEEASASVLRERVESRMQQMYDAMEENFRVTNNLIDFWNNDMKKADEHLKLENIAVDEEKSFKENIQMLQDHMAKIQEAVTEDLKKDMSPELREQLQNVEMPFEEFEHNSIGQWISNLIGKATGATVHFGTAVTKKATVAVMNKASSLLFKKLLGKEDGAEASVLAGKFIKGKIDDFFKEITDKHDLKKDIKEWDDILEEFDPASCKYRDAVNEIIAQMKVHVAVLK